MVECFICGVPGTKKRLFHAVHHTEGLIVVCEDCSKEENLPLLKKPTTFQLKETEQKKGIYERLSKAAGINPEEHRLRYKVEQQELERKKRRDLLTKEEVGLKEIIERNLKLRKQSSDKPRPGLIDNFHWIILRGRRKKHLTINQLADEIKESVVVLKMAEQGILPEDDFMLVNKLENFLGIRIRKEVESETSQGILKKTEEKKIPARILNFKPETIKNLTIADLQEMKKKRKQGIFGNENNSLKKENTKSP